MVGSSGGLVLHADQSTITGPAGTKHLPLQAFRVAVRLLQLPGAMVNQDSLIMAMYPDADDEADTSPEILRRRLKQLRDTVHDVTGGAMTIRNERGFGWAIEEVRR